MAAEQSRVEWVDASKGICILLVVMFHATIHLTPVVGAGGVFDTVTRFSAPFRMPDFFLISGLFLARRIHAPIRQFLDRKVLHYAYFYWLWVLITFAVLTPRLSSGVDAFLGQLGWAMIYPNGPLWFIYCLPICFLIARATAFLPPVVVWLAAAGFHVFDIAGEPLIAVYLSHYFVFFYTGYLAAPAIFALAARAAARPWLALAGLAAWAGLNGAVVFALEIGFPGLSLVMGVAGGCAVATIAALLAKSAPGQALSWLGARSIVVYLGFFIPLRFAKAVLLSIAGLPVDVVIGLAITAGVTMPLLLHLLIARTGAGRWLFERPGWATLGAPRAATA